MEDLINIRTAKLKDAAQIATVHIESWRTTYRGIVADTFLDSMDVEAKTKFWKNALAGNCDHIFVAEEGENIVGFAIVGKSRDSNEYESELFAIYILKEYQKAKLGSQLLAAVAVYLQSLGQNSTYVWVLEENQSKHFYERLGGKMFDKKEIELADGSHQEIAFGWRDLNELIKKARESEQ